MIRNCKAAVTTGDGKFSIETIQVKPPGPGEVLVRMKAAGICHTDYDSLSWKKHLVLGHEGSGIIEKIGEGVVEVAVGDHVILSWATHCGSCFQCQEGNQHICERQSPVIAADQPFNPGQGHKGSTTWRDAPIERSFNLGTLSEYAVVKASAVVRNVSNKMSFPAASIISCGVMTGYGSVVNAARVTPGTSVVVLGSGGVGLNVIQGARISGASQIIAVDINEQRLAMAREFGATHTLKADKQDRGLLSAAQKVREMTAGRGADYAFECTAIPELGAAPLAMVRNAGMAVQVSGIEQEISIDMNLFEWDKVYINPLYGKCRPQIDFPRLIALYEKGSLLLEEMVTRTYPLDELEKAFEDMLAGRNAKGVIKFE